MSEVVATGLTAARWRLKAGDEQAAMRFTKYLGLSPLAACALACRGVTQVEEARKFLEDDPEGILDPMQMADMDRALGAVEAALSRGGLIRIYGDYDADGVCATALLVRALQGLDGNVDWYIPHRVEEGYGLNEEAVRQAKADGVALLITVDCGSTAVAEIDLALGLGVQVVVCDHHRPGRELPKAPVLNPWRDDCPYPFKELAGVGVAFKLVSALARARGLPEGSELRFLDLVCLGTIADVVPLLGENRLFVQHGLRALANSRKLGLKALIEAANLSGEIASHQVAFVLAPRINAAGRMEHAQAAVKLLLTRDATEAEALARTLSEQNRLRREEEKQTLAEAEALIDRELDLSREKVIVLAREGWHPGVIGIVASRLVERYHRPALMIAVAEGVGKGSGRSVAALNLWEALGECSSLLIHYGGHRYAAGFGLSSEQILPLRRRINEIAEAALSWDELVRTIEIDGVADLAELSIEVVGELNRLAPFGMGNPRPLLVSHGLSVEDVRAVGDGSHLTMRLRSDPKHCIGAGWFRQAEFKARLADSGRGTVSVCYRPQLDSWNRSLRVRLQIEDIALAGEE